MSASVNEAHELSAAFHRLLFSFQKLSGELWKDRLADVSTLEISILGILWAKPETVVKDLLTALDVPASTLTNAINRLEKRKLVERKINPADKRSYRLELTQEGAEAQEEHIRGEVMLWNRIFAAFRSGEERRNLLDMLNKLADQF